MSPSSEKKKKARFPAGGGASLPLRSVPKLDHSLAFVSKELWAQLLSQETERKCWEQDLSLKVTRPSPMTLPQPGPSPNSPFRYQLISRLIHWWSWCPQDPVTSIVPYLGSSLQHMRPLMVVMVVVQNSFTSRLERLGSEWPLIRTLMSLSIKSGTGVSWGFSTLSLSMSF